LACFQCDWRWSCLAEISDQKCLLDLFVSMFVPTLVSYGSPIFVIVCLNFVQSFHLYWITD
jgi:hypothetical protein